MTRSKLIPMALCGLILTVAPAPAAASPRSRRMTSRLSTGRTYNDSMRRFSPTCKLRGGPRPPIS